MGKERVNESRARKRAFNVNAAVEVVQVEEDAFHGAPSEAKWQVDDLAMLEDSRIGDFVVLEDMICASFSFFN